MVQLTRAPSEPSSLPRRPLVLRLPEAPLRPERHREVQPLPQEPHDVHVRPRGRGRVRGVKHEEGGHPQVGGAEGGVYIQKGGRQNKNGLCSKTCVMDVRT